MRWLSLALILLAFKANAQVKANSFELFARQLFDSPDIFGYLDPDFKWDMEGRIQMEMNEGINYLKEGTPNLALPKFERATAADEDLWVGFYFAGVSLKQLRRFSEAEVQLHYADRLNKKNFFIYLELAKVNQLLKRYESSEKYFEMAQELRPASPYPSYFLGNLYAIQGQTGRAKDLFKKSLATDPMMLDAQLRIGVIEEMEKPGQALSYMNDILGKDSLYRGALVIRAELLADKDPKASLKDWDKLVRLNPGDIYFRVMRGYFRAEMGMFDEAFSDLRKVVEQLPLNENKFSGQQTMGDQLINIGYAGYYVMANMYGLPPADAALIRKAYCLLVINKYDESLAAVNNVSVYDTPLCFFLKGLANEHKGDHEKAYKAYDVALRLDNDILDAHKKRGIYLMEMQRWGLAERDFNEMLRINPEAIFAFRVRGLCQYYRGKYNEAINDFTSYLKVDSLNNEVRGFRGMAYQKNKDLLTATVDFLESGNHQGVEPFPVLQKELEKLLAVKDTATVVRLLYKFTNAEPSFIGAQKYLLNILMSKKQWKDVSLQADRALLRTLDTKGRMVGVGYLPEDMSHLLSVKGTALLYLDDPEGAIMELDRAIERDKKNPLAYLSRGKANLKLGNRSAATSDLKKAENLGRSEAKEILQKIKQ